VRVLVVNWQDRLNPQAGGAEIHLHEVFGRLAGWGHEISLLTSGFSGCRAEEELDGIRILRVGGRLTFGLRVPGVFRRRWPREHFDVIVEDLNKVPVFLPLLTKTPMVLLVHHLFGSTAFQSASFPVAAATWLLERPVPRAYRSCAVVAVSESTAEDLRQRGLEDGGISIVPNGVDLETYSPDPGVVRSQDPTLLYLGRLKRYKRVDLILKAVAGLKARVEGLRFLVAGTGSEEERLKHLSSSLGLGETVRFLGYVSEEEKIRLLRTSWVHVLTSPKEGWGISALEAAACGTPTVASDSPGLRDAVQDGETGVLVPHGSVESLVSALENLIESNVRRKEMGEKARSFAEAYSWERSARQMLAILEDRVAQGHPPQ
jgi:glycosyltransferase involved in cell wall biosynthesis